MRRAFVMVLLAALLLGLAPWAFAAPPRWAPAHGRRRKVVRTRVYVPAPFVYSGVTYVPLRDATSLVGAALLWDSLKGRAAVTYNGRELGLVVGSPRVYVGDEVLTLAAAPIVVSNVVYVPADFCDRYLEVPTRHRGGVFEIEGPRGWHSYRVAPRPPGRILHVASPRAGRYVAPRATVRRERVRSYEPRARVHTRREVRGRSEGRPEARRPRAEGRGRDRGEARGHGGRDRGERGQGHGRGGGRN